jgi:hypothetical protein
LSLFALIIEPAVNRALLRLATLYVDRV